MVREMQQKKFYKTLLLIIKEFKMRKTISLFFFFACMRVVLSMESSLLPGMVDEAGASIAAPLNVLQIEVEGESSLKKLYLQRMRFEQEEYFHRSVALQGGGVRGAWSASAKNAL